MAFLGPLRPSRNDEPITVPVVTNVDAAIALVVIIVAMGIAITTVKSDTPIRTAAAHRSCLHQAR